MAKRSAWHGFFASLPPAELALIERAAELREAREAAERAMRSGNRERMVKALARLEKANANAKELR